MIKNIIVDVGGVIADNSSKKFLDEQYREKLNLTYEEIKELNNTIFFEKEFNDCLLGNLSIYDYTKKVTNKYPKYKKEIEYLLDPKFYKETFPVKKDVVDYLYSLKEKGYKIYFLTNISLESYDYLKNIFDDFAGGVYSFSEHLIKPDERIYQLIREKYHLKKEETIFFDDKDINVEVANKVGLKAIVYHDLTDIKENI